MCSGCIFNTVSQIVQFVVCIHVPVHLVNIEAVLTNEHIIFGALLTEISESIHLVNTAR